MSPASEPTAFLGVVSTAIVEYMHIESSQLHRSVGVEVLENLLGTFVPIPTDEAEPFAFLVFEQVTSVPAFFEEFSRVLDAFVPMFGEVVVSGEPLVAGCALPFNPQVTPEFYVIFGDDHVEHIFQQPGCIFELDGHLHFLLDLGSELRVHRDTIAVEDVNLLIPPFLFADELPKVIKVVLLLGLSDGSS